MMNTFIHVKPARQSPPAQTPPLSLFSQFQAFLFTVLAVLLPMRLAGAAPTDDYPNRAITLVVPSTPGGGTDTSSRIIVPKLSENLGQPIVISNKPGVSGNIGAAFVANATPDGYTLLTLISSHVINPHMFAKVGYEIDKDFTPISQTVTVPDVLIAHKSLPAQNLAELMAYLKANPDKINFGSAGMGSFSHLMMEFFALNAGVKLLHVPYKSTSQAFNDVLSNHVSMMVADIALANPFIKSGALKAYGVSSLTRSDIAPEIPSLSELGLKGFEANQWFGLVGPAKLPPQVTEKIFNALKKTLSDPELKAKLAADGMTSSPSATPQEFAGFMRTEGLKWSKIIKEAKIETEKNQ
jgi:tripartite-type tricarboxylate transporter receptor subunit TctC